MDIWEQLYEKARAEYHPEEVTPFFYAHNVVCALESASGRISSPASAWRRAAAS